MSLADSEFPPLERCQATRSIMMTAPKLAHMCNQTLDDRQVVAMMRGKVEEHDSIKHAVHFPSCVLQPSHSGANQPLSVQPNLR